MNRSGFRLLLASVMLVLALSAAATKSFDNESLSYKVMYKWGLINKKAGTVTLTLKNSGDEYRTKLVAASEPWADKFYKVRDTLNGRILKKGFRPLFYEKIAHEGGDYKHDAVQFGYNDAGGTLEVSGKCIRREYKKGKMKRNERRELSAVGTTVDMLSAYYYMRSLPYEKWTAGHTETMTIFSGKRKEILAIKYLGISDVEVDKKKTPVYHIVFIFTSDSGKKTSDNMDAWISADSRRIPLKLEGHLPVGKVQCYYTGQ